MVMYTTEERLCNKTSLGRERKRIYRRLDQRLKCTASSNTGAPTTFVEPSALPNMRLIMWYRASYPFSLDPQGVSSHRPCTRQMIALLIGGEPHFPVAHESTRSNSGESFPSTDQVFGELAPSMTSEHLIHSFLPISRFAYSNLTDFGNGIKKCLNHELQTSESA